MTTNGAVLGRIEKKTLKKDVAYQYLRKAIVTCRIKPGDMLDEVTIAQHLGISRTPIREAINRLVEEGLVTVMPKRGLLVNQIAYKDVIDMLEARLMIEPDILSAAFHRMEHDVLMKFRDYVTEKIDSGDLTPEEPEQDFDFTFHMYFAERAANRYLIEAMRSMMTQNQRFRAAIVSGEPERVQDVHREHLEILDHLLSGDEESAVSSIRRHQANGLLDFKEHYRGGGWFTA